MNNSTKVIALIAVAVIVIAAAAVISGNSDKSDNGKVSTTTPDRIEGEYCWGYSFADYYQTNVYSIPTLPSEGNTFVKVTVKIKNVDSDSLTTSKSNFKFTADGITYSAKKVMGNSGFFADKISKGDTVALTMYFDVPSGVSDIEFKWIGKENVQRVSYL